MNITKNILQCQQGVESFAELSEPIRILSSVIQTFAVIRSLVLMRLQNCSINSPDHGSFPAAKYECLWTCVSCLKAGGFPSQ